MKTNLIYGLRTCRVYVVVIAALLLIETIIDVIVGRHVGSYFSIPYFTIAAFGVVVSFICGYTYPFLLSKSIKSYMDKYPDVPRKYVEEICQGKVRYRYSAILSGLCMVCSFFFDMDEYPLIVYAFTGAAFTFLFQYLKYRKKYKNL